MPEVYEIRAYGDPQPKGDLKPVNLPGRKFTTLVDSNPKLKGWQRIVTAAAMAFTERDCTHKDPLIRGPVTIYLYFTMKRPKSAKFDAYPATRPDIDKLTRGVFDCLTKANVYEDDSRIVKQLSLKLYPKQGSDALARPGVLIRVRQALPPRKD